MNTHFRDNKGFTLVELAVVMVIIGLLIGGILKGQEMIENARVNAAISQIKAVTAASSTFQDMYDAIPGDMLTAAARLPGAPGNGDGNNQLDNAPFVVPAAGDETILFFEHLAAADLLAGTLTTNGMGADIRGAEISVSEQVGAAQVGDSAANVSGRFIVIAESAGGPATVGLTPLQAGRIDRKLDDGDPDTGSVLATGGATCHDGTNYLEADNAILCSIASRMD